MSAFAKLALAVAALLTAPLALGADAERGRALYELHCGGCHSESVHGRQKRAAESFDEVRAWVSRWNEHLGLRWSGEEIDEVTVYVNGTYYRYTCPSHVCTVISLSPPPPTSSLGGRLRRGPS